jgi:hypothetical protein
MLDLAVDPRGGDVVQLRLIQYPRRQEVRIFSCSITAVNAPTWRRAVDRQQCAGQIQRSRFVSSEKAMNWPMVRTDGTHTQRGR